MSQGSGDGFEDGFHAVVCVVAANEVDVQVQAGVVRECGEKFEAQGCGECADAFFGECGVIDQVRASRQIDHGAGEGFVHGDVGKAESRDAGFVAQCVREGVAQADADVFDGVVGIDFEVAFAGDGEVE